MFEVIGILVCVFVIPIILYKTTQLQEKFSDRNERSFSLVTVASIYLVFLVLLYISFVIFDINSIKNSYFKQGTDIIIFILSTINIIVYLIFPLAYFFIQVTEEHKKSKLISHFRQSQEHFPF